MRRTQQNADRQRRRGVRSRLVACVAAVAMLVTSVAAGTAVAAELGGGDAADQTTQNTATLEQQGPATPVTTTRSRRMMTGRLTAISRPTPTVVPKVTRARRTTAPLTGSA